jgi:thioredoxin 2
MNIRTCVHCGAKNRIPPDKEGTAKCGRCHQPLTPQSETEPAREKLTLRCGQCRAKNRVPAAKLDEGPKCGRCGAALEHKDLLDGRTVMVTDANFDAAVMRSPLPVLLYAWAPWCSVCGGTGPMVEQLAQTVKGKVRVAKVNIDANPKLAQQYNILSVPAFFVFDGGELKLHLPGAVPAHELMLKMAPFV